MIDPVALADFAEETAREAGNILKEGFRSKGLKINYKAPNDCVTNIDLRSEQHIVDRIQSAFPQHAIIAEEGHSIQNDGTYIWYVDPLDGTNNYAHGLNHFCVSIAVFSQAESCMLAGVVYDPIQDELFKASRGLTSPTINGTFISVSEINELKMSLIATGFPYNKLLYDEKWKRTLCNMISETQDIRRMGSAALDLAYVACGRYDGYWEGNLHSWDIAAGCLICEMAGGRVSDLQGRSLQLNKGTIIASNGAIHKQMVTILHSSVI